MDFIDQTGSNAYVPAGFWFRRGRLLPPARDRHGRRHLGKPPIAAV
jgi:hypothetical protein